MENNLNEVKSDVLKKHVATIHSENSITLLQRKISNALLYHAYPNLLKNEIYEINIKQLCKIIGYNGNNHQVIKNALKGLMTCLVEWNVLNEKMVEINEWNASTILAGATIKGSSCFYSYSPQMRTLLHTPTLYGKINLIIQAKFHSTYGLALYENCIRYKGLPCTKWFDLKIFRKLMGVPDGKYEIFRDFNKRVLTKAIQEVNKHSDLLVEPEINRQGHKVINIRFKLDEKEKKKCLGKNFKERIENEIVVGQDLLDAKLYQEFGIFEEKISMLRKEYSREYILEKVNLIEQSNAFKKGKIDNLGAYLIKALQNNYQPTQSKFLPNLTLKKQNERDERDKLKSDQIKKKSYDQYRSNHIDQVLAALPEKQFEKIKLEFEKSLIESKNSFIQSKIRNAGFEYKTVQVYFRLFFELNYKVFLQDLMSYETYESQKLND